MTVPSLPTGPVIAPARGYSHVPARLLTGALPDLPVGELAHVIAARLLMGYRGHTEAAYRRDLRNYFNWCADHEVEVLDAGRSTIDSYARSMAAPVDDRRALSDATIARRLATLSSFYRYAVSENVITRSPLDHVRRPRLADDSPTLGLDKHQVRRFLAAAQEHGPRAFALCMLLVHNGFRISEVLTASVEDMGTVQNHRVLHIRRKGGGRRRVPLNDATASAVDAYLGGRADGPLIATRNGNALDRSEAWRLIRRLAAAANIPDADKISPHSLRHTFVTLSLAVGVPLQMVQDSAGHADPRTTRRYDKERDNLINNATYRLGEALADLERDALADTDG